MTFEEMVRRNVRQYHELGGVDWWDKPPITREHIIDKDVEAIVLKLVEDFYATP